jgi:hypothetical protein
MIKAREIRATLHENTDPKIIHILCEITESMNAQQQEINQLAELLNNVTDLIMQLGATIEGTHNAVDAIKGIRGDE